MNKLTVEKKENISKLKKTLFTLIMISLPVFILLIIEITLNLFNYGGDFDLFIKEDSYGGQKYVLNKNFSKRYFFKRGVNIPKPRTQTFNVNKDSLTYRVFCLGASTTQGVPYPPNAAFPAMLKYILTTLHPDTKFEILNCGVTAITSHSVLDMEREILQNYEPDLIVIYTGHNEFYGVFGQASRLSLFENRSLLQIFLNLQRLKLFRLGKDIFFNFISERIDPESVIDPGTLMGVIAKDAEIPVKSELYKQTAKHFERNIEVLIEEANNHNVGIIICNLIDNLKNLAPFASIHSNNLSTKQLEKSEKLLNKGQNYLKSNSIESAIELFLKSLQYDSVYAETHYLLGKSYERLHNYTRAKNHYMLARDNDAIRFRAPSLFNNIIKQVVNKNNVPFADIENIFNINSPGGIVGNNLILEHIHPNQKGYLLMAKTIAKTMSDWGMIKQNWDWPRDKSDSIYNSMSRMTVLSHEIVNAAVYRLTSHWPFKHEKERKEYRRVGTEKTEKLAREYIEKRKGNLIQLHFDLGDDYFSNGNLEEALFEYQAAMAVEPNCNAYNKIGQLYAKKCELAIHVFQDYDNVADYYKSALLYFNKGLEYCPDHSDLNFNRGVLTLQIRQDFPKAIESFKNVLKLNPYHQDALKYLSRIFINSNNFTDARIYLLVAVEKYPKDVEFLMNLGHVYLKEKKYPEAENWLKKAYKLKSNHPKIKSLLKQAQKY